jgi:L-threonylcarbamoyladenylate synthase
MAPAVELLRAGEVVALPTETVYGLAADARNATAVAKIFEAKERPRFDPLIVHLPAREMLNSVAYLDSRVAAELIGQFWPGPFTIVLPKHESVPDLVTAGLETVAVRMSAHPVFSEIAKAFGSPLAAPSANRFGRISPTAAQHVYDELAGRISLIVDGGATTHGVESTIVRVVDGIIQVLRAGPIDLETLGSFAPVRLFRQSESIVAPGQLPKHYAPRTKLKLVESFKDFSRPVHKRVGALTFASAPKGFSLLRQLSPAADTAEAAANLFRMLRELDAAKLDLIVAEKVPDEGIGVAINERLQRGAAMNRASPDARGRPE